MDVMHTREDTLVAREHQILAQLPPYYRKMCTRDMYHAQIKRCPLFNRASEQIIDRLVHVLVVRHPQAQCGAAINSLVPAIA